MYFMVHFLHFWARVIFFRGCRINCLILWIEYFYTSFMVAVLSCGTVAVGGAIVFIFVFRNLLLVY